MNSLEMINDIRQFDYCMNTCPYQDRYNNWCNYHYKDLCEIDYITCEQNKG